MERARERDRDRNKDREISRQLETQLDQAQTTRETGRKDKLTACCTADRQADEQTDRGWLGDERADSLACRTRSRARYAHAPACVEPCKSARPAAAPLDAASRMPCCRRQFPGELPVRWGISPP